VQAAAVESISVKTVGSAPCWLHTYTKPGLLPKKGPLPQVASLRSKRLTREERFRSGLRREEEENAAFSLPLG